MVTGDPVVLDTDTVSLVTRGSPLVSDRAKSYLTAHGTFTLTAVTVFERIRGYRSGIAAGRPYEEHLHAFESFVSICQVLAFDRAAAELAARIAAALSRRRPKALADVFIAAIAGAHGLSLVTRNRRDFAPIERLAFANVRTLDWSR